MLKEVEKAGWTIEAAIDECCLRTWASFKSSWVDKDKPNVQTKSKVYHDISNMDYTKGVNDDGSF
jgi:hypothetical protein